MNIGASSYFIVVLPRLQSKHLAENAKKLNVLSFCQSGDNQHAGLKRSA